MDYLRYIHCDAFIIDGFLIVFAIDRIASRTENRFLDLRFSDLFGSGVKDF